MANLKDIQAKLRKSEPGIVQSTAGSRSKSLEDIKRKAAASVAQDVDDKYIQSYLTDSQSYFTQAKSDIDGLSWATGSDKAKYEARRTTGQDLQKRSNKIRAYLNVNKSSVSEETYKGLMAQLDSDRDNYGVITDAFDNAYNVYSQWKSEDEYNAAVASAQEFQKKWGSYLEDENFGKASTNRNYVNPTEDDLRYYDVMLDNANWYWDANGTYRDAFGNEIPIEKGSTTIHHPMRDDERFTVADPVGFYLSMDKDRREGMAHEDWAKESERLGQILIKGTNEHWEMLSEDDLKMYYGLLGTHGLDKAMEYIDYYAANRNAQWGAAEAKKILSIENDFQRISLMGMLGLQSGAENWGTGVSLALGADVAPPSGYQYASTEISQTLDGFGKHAYDATVSVGNMLPSIIISKGLGSAGAGAAAMGISTGGNAYAQGLQEGMDEKQARNYGFLVGTSEATLQYLIGGLGELGGITDDILLSKAAMIDNSLLRVSAKLGISLGSEILEEELQLYLEPAFKAIITGGEYDAPTIDAMIETAIVTALSTGLLEGPGTIGGDIAGVIENNKYYKDTYGGVQNELVGKILEINPDNAYAQRMQGRLDSGKDLSGRQLNRLVQLNEKALTAQDMDTIQSAAETRLTELGETGDVSAIAAALARQAAEKKLTRSEQQAIANSKYGQRVANELNTENIKSGEYSSAWAENIVTERINPQEYSGNVESMTAAVSRQLVQSGVAPETAAQLAEMAVQGTSDPQMESIQEVTATAEGEQRQSAEGQVLYEGNPVQLGKVKTAGNGQLLVQLADGASVDASKLSFPDQGQQELYQIVGKIADSAGTANMLLQGLQKGDASARIYARAIEQAFFYGRHQIPLQQLLDESPFAQALTDQQLNDAYALGLMAGEKTAKQRQEKVQNGKNRQSNKKGRLHFEGDRGKLTERQKVSLQTCEIVAKALGIDVYVFESQKGENGKRVGDNGWYDPKDGSIHIDLYAGQNGEGVMVFTLAHELVHFIKDWSPAKFRKLAGFLAEQYGKKGVSIRDLVLEKQAKAKEDGRKLSFDQAYEEWVANSMETMLTDGTVVEKLTQLQATDKGLAQKIREFIKGFVTRLKNAYKGVSAQTKEGQIVSEMVDAAQQLQDLFADALIDAGNTYRSTEKNTTDDGGEIRFMSREDSTRIKQQIETAADRLNQMDVVVSVTSDGFPGKWDSVIAKELAEEFSKFGNQIDRQNFGVILLNEKLINKALGYLKLPAEKAALLTVPRVLKRGIQIDTHTKHKERGVDSYTFAAPVEINGKRGNVGVVVQRESKTNRFKTLRILLPNGKAFELTKNNEADSTHGSSPKHSSPGGMPIESASTVSINGEEENVKINSERRSSARTADGVSPRELLLNTVEGMVANSEEWQQLQKYRGMIKSLNEAEKHLERINDEIGKESAKNYKKRDLAYMEKLLQQRKDTLALLDKYDSQLINLENTKPIQDIVQRMKAEAYQRGFDQAKSYYRTKADAREQMLKQHYQESRRNAVERHDKAQIRQQIRKDVERLASLLNKGNKQKNVKQELQAFAGAALRTAQGTFLNNYNEYDMIRNGVHNRLMNEHQPIFDRCRELLKELDKLRDEKNTEPGATSMHDKWDPEAELRRDDREEALKKELSKNMRILRDANVFRTENEGLQSSTAEELMTELLAAYSALKNSQSEHVKRVFNQAVYDKIDDVKKFLGGKAVKDMTMVELKELQTMYRMVLHTVTHSSDLFTYGKEAKTRDRGQKILEEIGTQGKERILPIANFLKKFELANLKMETVLEMIGSNTLTESMQHLYDGEDVVARDIDDARKYAQEQAEKYHRWKWRTDKVIDFAGTQITLGQAMSLYAYSKRLQSEGHLKGCGFTHAAYIRIKARVRGFLSKGILGKLNIKLPFTMNPTKRHTVTESLWAEIPGHLTKDQRGYVDAMVKYLTEVMGAKGNEVSMKLYGIELFNESYYFPIQSAKEFIDSTIQAAKGEKKLTNSGFTLKPVEGADNAIVLDDFERIWSGHIDQMSTYHGLALPLEDFDRVYNYHREIEQDVLDAEGELYKTEQSKEPESVKTYIMNRFGNAFNQYIEQFIQQLNGGVRNDPTEDYLGKLFKNWKKTRVLGSASVIVSQPTAVIRALPYFNLVEDTLGIKNLLGKDGKPSEGLIKEMYKYCPVSVMKKIGGFDPSVGNSSQDYMIGTERHGIKKVTGMIDYAAGVLPEGMDTVAWTYIWIMSKRRTQRLHPELRVGSKEFCEEAAKIFSHAVRDSQVYDSAMVKTKMLRSKNPLVQQATAFMNEPSTAIDQCVRARYRYKNGKITKGQLWATYASKIVSDLMNAAVVALIYAFRDDDEDETYWEKYVSAGIGRFLDGLLLWNNIPFLKDIASLISGYDVERTDMAVFADLVTAWNSFIKGFDEEATKDDTEVDEWKRYEAFAGSILDIFGIPLKNVSREVRGVYNYIEYGFKGPGTKAGMKYAINEGIFRKETPKKIQIHNAVVEDDGEHILRMINSYEERKKGISAVKGAILDAYKADQITDELAQEQLQIYVGLAEDEAERELLEVDLEKEYPKIGSREKHLLDAITKDDEEHLQMTMAVYAKEETAMSEVRSAIKQSYLSGEITEGRAKNLLITYGGVEREDVSKKIAQWRK